MTPRVVIIALVVARAVTVSLAPVSRTVIVSRTPVVRAFVTNVEAGAASTADLILTESNDTLTTEASDSLEVDV